MGIAPQRRISKTRKRQRRSHFKLDNPSMMVCPNCGEFKLAHTVCSSCGYYDGKLVKEIKAKEDDEKVEETIPPNLDIQEQMRLRAEQANQNNLNQ